jgi:hypothetical protein
VRWNRAVELTVAIVFVGGWAWAGAVQPAWSDAVAIAIWIVPSVAAGLVIGRWWAAALAPAAAVALLVGYAFNPCVPGGDVECDVNAYALVLAYFMPPAAAFLFLGVGIRRGARALRR